MTIKKKVRVDKDYCSSTVWCNGANWEESDFGFNEKQLTLASNYDNLWEEAHRDVYNVDKTLYKKAQEAKFVLLKDLYKNRKDIEWYCWDDVTGEEVKFYDN